MKLLIVGLLLSLSVILSACTITGPAVQDTCRALENSAKDDCYQENLRCSKIKNRDTRDSCVAELAKVKNDVAVCDLIIGDRTQAYCQEQIAVLQNNHALCTDIEDSYWKDNCNFHLALNNSKDVYCSLIHNQEQKDSCFTEIAYTTNNILLCEFLQSDAEQRCIFTIAVHLQDIRMCEQLQEPLNQDTCRLKIAKEKGAVSICNSIHFKEVKMVCEEYFKN